MTRREWFIATFAVAVFAAMCLSGCMPQEVRRWNKDHPIPCDADNCGKRPNDSQRLKSQMPLPTVDDVREPV